MILNFSYINFSLFTGDDNKSFGLALRKADSRIDKIVEDEEAIDLRGVSLIFINLFTILFFITFS